jgi:hypothetical protein
VWRWKGRWFGQNVCSWFHGGDSWRRRMKGTSEKGGG